MASPSKGQKVGPAVGAVACVGSIRLDDPRFVELDRRYATDYDRRWQEHRRREIEAEIALWREGFVITY